MSFFKKTVRFFVKYRFFRHMNFYLSVARNIIIEIKKSTKFIYSTFFHFFAKFSSCLPKSLEKINKYQSNYF